MDTGALKAYTKLTAFLGHALGPYYEVSLFDYVGQSFVLVAIANVGISGRKLGDTLSEEEMRISSEGKQKDSNYIVHYKNKASSGKVLRASTLFLKNEQEELSGLLCINFDDSHYTELSDKILELCHPHAFVETNFSYNSKYMEKSLPEQEGNSEANGLESVEKQVERLILQLGMDKATLGSKEKLRIVKELEKNHTLERKGAIQKAAQALGCSLATMYRYIAQAKNE